MDDFGLKEVKFSKCNSARESAERIEAVFSGKGKEEDLNFILVNASAALYVSEIASDFKEGVDIAKNAIDEGLVIKKLVDLRS